MKKDYLNPEIFITLFNTGDVITFSPAELSINALGDGNADYIDFSALMNQ